MALIAVVSIAQLSALGNNTTEKMEIITQAMVTAQPTEPNAGAGNCSVTSPQNCPPKTSEDPKNDGKDNGKIGNTPKGMK